MLMYLIIAALLVVTIFFSFIEERIAESQKVVILSAYVIFMVFLATTKSVEHTADALNYFYMFNNNTDKLTEIATEPTFIYMSRIVSALGGTIGVIFFLYAIITIPFKIRTLYQMTPFIFTALVIYIPVYFELHDMVQIRAAAAATFLLASLLPLCKKQYMIASVLMICAILFHYSAVCYLPFLFIGNRKLNIIWRVTIACLIPLCFAMYLLKMDLFSLIPTSLTEGKLDFYQKSSEKGEWGEMAVLYKNIYFMSKCAILCLYLYFYDYIVQKHPLAPILINLFAASILFLLSMATIPVLASRISDMYGIVDCIVFTFSLYLVNPKFLVKIGISLIALYSLVYNILFADYFT